MELKKIHALIRKMSSSEKLALSKWVKLHGSKLDLTLYNRLQRVEQLDPEVERLLRDKEFSSSSQYYIYRIRLAESILKSLAGSKRHPMHLVSIVQTAIDWDMMEVGHRFLVHEMSLASKKEDYCALRYWYDLISRIENDHNLKVKIPDEIPDSSEVSELYRIDTDLRKLIQEIRDARVLTGLERSIQAGRIEKEISKIDPKSRSTEDLKILARKNLAVLKQEYSTALELALYYLERVRNWEDKYSVIHIAKEMLMTALISAFLGKRNRAIQYSLAICRLAPKTIQEEKNLQHFRIRAAIDIGEFYADLNQSHRGYADLINHLTIFPESRKKRMFILVGLTFFYNEMYLDAYNCFQECIQIDCQSDPCITWEPYFLAAICQFELGNDTAVDSLVHNVRRSITSDSQFPVLCLQQFEELRKTPLLERKTLIGGHIRMLESMLKDESERRITYFFPYPVWLESKYRQKPQFEIVQGMENRTERVQYPR